MKDMERTGRALAAGLLAIASTGCATVLGRDLSRRQEISYYAPSPIGFIKPQNYRRPEVDGSAESWRNLYGSIRKFDPNIYEVTESEARYLRKFLAFNSKTRRGILDDKRLQGFDFINREDPSPQDIIFIYNFLSH